MNLKETDLPKGQTSLVFCTPEFPDGVEFLIFEKDGRFSEGADTSKILDKYISEIPSTWIGFPESIKRILYSMDRLGFSLDTFSGMENHYDVFWIKVDFGEKELTLYFSEFGYPSRWFWSTKPK